MTKTVYTVYFFGTLCISGPTRSSANTRVRETWWAMALMCTGNWTGATWLQWMVTATGCSRCPGQVQLTATSSTETSRTRHRLVCWRWRMEICTPWRAILSSGAWVCENKAIFPRFLVCLYQTSFKLQFISDCATILLSFNLWKLFSNVETNWLTITTTRICSD